MGQNNSNNMDRDLLVPTQEEIEEARKRTEAHMKELGLKTFKEYNDWVDQHCAK